MKAQRTGYWCGIASIANALEMLGIKRTQREIAKLCDVTPAAGTDETEMKRALLANGVQIDEWHSANRVASYCWLRDCLNFGWPVILCVDLDDHWLTAIGLCGQRFVLFDPSRNTGVEVHDASSLASRWKNEDDIYYGLAVTI